MVRGWRAITFCRCLLGMMWKVAQARETWPCWTLHYNPRIAAFVRSRRSSYLALDLFVWVLGLTIQCNLTRT